MTIALGSILIALVLGAPQAAAAADINRAWTMLEQGAAAQDADTRVRAIEALGLLAKDERAPAGAGDRVHPVRRHRAAGRESFRQDTVSPVRAAAAQRLAADPDPASGRALANATKDEQWLVRAAAVSALASRGDRSLAAAVAARLDDENETVRITAAAALVRLETAPAHKSGDR